jgi:hypothetical protein
VIWCLTTGILAFISLAVTLQTSEVIAEISTPSDNSPANPVDYYPTITRASDFELERWRNGVLEGVVGGGLLVHGPTANAVAEALLSLLEFHRSSTPPVFPDDVVCEVTPLHSFIQRWHNIRMYVLMFPVILSLMIYISGPGPQAGVGNGPVCSVLRAGVHRLVEKSPIFNLRGDFYHASFLPVISLHRENSFWVAGFWSAIHLVTLLLAPDPISPWLLYAAAYGKEGFPTDLNYIRALDPTSAQILDPWFAFGAADTLSDDVLGPIQQLLMTYLDVHEVSLRF